MLASGSSGNAAYVGSGGTRVLIDAGLTAREFERRLSLFDLTIGEMDGIVITHEHADHVAGLAALAGRFGRTIYLTPGTRKAIRSWPKGAKLIEFEPGRVFTIGSLSVHPFPLSHDAAEPVGFTFGNDAGKVGYVTDLGKVTAPVRDALCGCRILAIEFNHDGAMLRNGPYPLPLKRRILGDEGHLSNDVSADLLRSSAHDGLEWVFLSHLSRTNNRADVAIDAARRALSDADTGRIRVQVASQTTAGPFISLDKSGSLW